MLRTRGFTLIELVTMMIIIGIISVFALGRLDFTTVFEQRGVQDKVKAALQFARRAAVAERRYICVAVAGGVITLKRDTRVPETTPATFCDGSAASNLDLPGPDRTCSPAASNAVCSSTHATITSTAAAIVFDPQGHSTAGAVATVTVPGQPSGVTVTVEGTTGYVH